MPTGLGRATIARAATARKRAFITGACSFRNVRVSPKPGPHDKEARTGALGHGVQVRQERTRAGRVAATAPPARNLHYQARRR